MKTIITSALVISGVMGSAMAEPVVNEQSHDLLGNLSGSQTVMPKGNLGNSVTLTGFALGTPQKEQPKLARSNSFDEEKEAEPFMSKAEPEVVANKSWINQVITTVITWVKSIFCF